MAAAAAAVAAARSVCTVRSSLWCLLSSSRICARLRRSSSSSLRYARFRCMSSRSRASWRCTAADGASARWASSTAAVNFAASSSVSPRLACACSKVRVRARSSSFCFRLRSRSFWARCACKMLSACLRCCSSTRRRVEASMLCCSRPTKKRHSRLRFKRLRFKRLRFKRLRFKRLRFGTAHVSRAWQSWTYGSLMGYAEDGRCGCCTTYVSAHMPSASWTGSRV